MENNLYINKNECCGCSACFNVCPVGAIQMTEDSEGFLYPNVDEKKCIKCGLCRKVCLYKESCERNDDYSENLCVWTAKHRDLDCRLSSQSGGAFSALSEEVLLLGGTIYGCAIDNQFTAIHKRAITHDERDCFKGSKYIQSKIQNTYYECKCDLDDGKYVMFTGTPCQIDGLKRFLGKHKNINKLYLVDIICHGVNSPMVWKKYINFVAKKSIASVDFRYKFIGWGSHFEKIEFSDGTKYVSEVFAKLFCSNLILRPSCYSCKFANLQRCSDITIGDSWGIKKKNPKFYDLDGVSLIIANTVKGKNLVLKSERNLQLISCKIEDYIQPQLLRPVKCPENRENFWQDLNHKSFEIVLRKYAKYGLRRKLKGLLLKYDFIIKVLRKLNLR